MSYIHHRLEYIQDGQLRYIRNEMITKWLEGSFLFTTCFEKNKINDSNIEKYISLFKTKPKEAKAVLLVREDTQQKHIDMLTKYIPTLLFNQFIWEAYKVLPEETKWDMNSDKFVCLTGRPNKYNRYRLIVEMSKRNLLERCDYSLQLTQGNLDESLQHLNGEDRNIYNNFDLNSTVDDCKWYITEQGNSWISNPLNTDVLNNKLFRLISESEYEEVNQYNFVTEKTWLTIGYKLPFLIAGQSGICKYLNKLGFHTFDEYLVKPYDSISDSAERMHTLLDNVEHWLNNRYPDMYDKIQENYNLLIQMGKQQDNIYKHALENILQVPYDNVTLYHHAIKPLEENRKRLD